MFNQNFIDRLGPRFWYHLRCFSHVVSFKSYAKAAHHLHLSPSSMTKAIQALEADLKVSLLDRGGRRALHLTPQGDQLYRHSAALFGRLLALERSLYPVSEEGQFSLSLALPEWVLCDYLITPLMQFKRQHPGFRIQLSTHSEGAPEPELQMVVGACSDSHRISKPLVYWSLALYASAAYSERFAWPHRLDDLKDHVCLGWRTSDLNLSKALNWHCLSEQSSSMALGFSSGLIKMAQMDVGIMSCFKGHPALQESGLLEFAKSLSEAHAPRISLYLVATSAAWAQREVQSLYQHLKQSFEGGNLSRMET